MLDASVKRVVVVSAKRLQRRLHAGFDVNPPGDLRKRVLSEDAAGDGVSGIERTGYSCERHRLVEHVGARRRSPESSVEEFVERGDGVVVSLRINVAVRGKNTCVSCASQSQQWVSTASGTSEPDRR
jgi:hypothetical protein